MTNNRIIWVDSLKGWLMLLVIIGHAIQSVLGDDCNNNHLWNLIYSFHMPAFMAVSGWLMFRPNLQNNDAKVIWRRFQQLMIPYFVWSLISYLTYGEYTVERFLNIILRPDAFFWFLWSLFFIYVFFWGAQWLSNRIKISEDYLIVGLSFLLMIVMVIVDIRVLGFQQIAYYFLFYSLGYFFHKYPKLIVNRLFFLLLLGLVWLTLAWFWKQHDIPEWLPQSRFIPLSVEQYLYRGITTLIAIVVIMSSALILINGDGRFNQFFGYLGEISIGLYVVHLSFGGMKLIIKVINGIIPNVSFTLIIILSSLFSLILSTLIVTLLMKNKILSKILFGKI